jgi:hypothetical protein
MWTRDTTACRRSTWPTTPPPTTVPAWCTRRRPMAWTTSTAVSPMASRCTDPQPGAGQWPYAPDLPLFGGQNIWKACPQIIETLRQCRPPVCDLQPAAQLPALLAPQDAGDLPGGGPVVHPHGRGRRRLHQGQGAPDLAPAGARRDRADRVLPGERPHAAARHDRRAAGLVHQPPAQLGRAAAVLHPPRHRRTASAHDGDPRPGRRHGARPAASRPGARPHPSPSSAPRMRRSTPRATTSWRSGSTPAPPTPRCSRARTPAAATRPGPRPTCTWKAMTSTAAGSTPRC